MHRLKVIEHWSFSWRFPTGAENATVFGIVDPPKCKMSSSALTAYPKGTSLCQDVSFEPSTIEIGQNVWPVEMPKKQLGIVTYMQGCNTR